MDSQQALNVVYQVARLAPVNADAHQQVLEAVKVLQEALKPKEEKKK